MKQYKAHWSALLVIISALLTVLCLGIAWFYLLRGGWWLSLLLVALTIGCALFSIRGYTITPDAILVHRPFWRTRLPLADLRAAEIKRAPTLRGIRIGNGGFFSFTGWRYSPGLGFYRVFLTDHRQAIMLHYPTRKVVISPASPEDFLHDLSIPSHAG